MGIVKRCSLCGGKLDHTRRCTECGLDNTKNDSMYKHMVSQNDCENQPLTHVHEEAKPNKKYGKVTYTYKNQPATARPIASTARKTVNTSKKKGGVAGIVITIIILVYTIIPTIFSLVQNIDYDIQEEVYPDEFLTPEEEYDYEYWLSTGFHEAGVHIPTGWCEVEIESGEWVDLVIYRLDDDMTFMEKDFFYLSDGECAEFYLDEGDFLFVEAVDDLLYTNVWLYTDSSDFTETVWIDATEMYMIEGECEVGTDFPAGIYDVLYIPESYGESGDVFLSIQNPDVDDSVFVSDLHFECYDDSFNFGEEDTYGYYANVPLTPGSLVSVDDSLGTIYLCPSYETSQRTYDITWGASAE